MPRYSFEILDGRTLPDHIVSNLPDNAAAEAHAAELAMTHLVDGGHRDRTRLWHLTLRDERGAALRTIRLGNQSEPNGELQDASLGGAMRKMSAGFAAVAAMAVLSPVHGQNVVFPGMPGVDGLPRGENGVFHGNYCGLGNNGPGLPPTDALDAACMHHDACTPTGRVPSCACNARFLRESHAVAGSAAQPDDLKALAIMVEAAVPIIPCR